MILTVKHELRLFLIALLVIHLTGCATNQKATPPTTASKDEWFAKDKLQHFTAFFLIGVLSYSIARGGEANKDDASIIGFSFSSACGIAKEINDEAKRNDWSYKDLVWDIIGGAGGVSVSNVLD
jgi:uncharacterized protein YfiM (DUF2279 family)